MDDAAAIPSDSADSAESAEPEGKPPLKERYKALLTEFGATALVTWFAIFGVSIVGFATLIKFGVEVDGAGGEAGTWGAAYLATQVIKPIRIALTLALTPLVAGAWRAFRGHEVEKPPE